MYLPTPFKEDRLKVLHDAIQQAGLAMLVTTGHDAPDVSHLPLMLDPSQGAYGTLYGHMARANDQWRTALPGQPALAVFTGPESYVSPSCYPGKAVHGRVVPTWNYVAVHARGALRVFDDAKELLDIVSRLTERHEAGREQPWQASDAPADFMASQLRAIVGFAVQIDRIEGKWKMSQNRSLADRDGVVAALETGSDAGQAVARLVSGQG